MSIEQKAEKVAGMFPDCDSVNLLSSVYLDSDLHLGQLFSKNYSEVIIEMISWHTRLVLGEGCHINK